MPTTNSKNGRANRIPLIIHIDERTENNQIDIIEHFE
jgi:hypothetical protein